ncbi:phage tail protein [Chitinophaga solisilvae]|uniref:Phage tail protein n=1 Tax=Chitinophaga solisilvae TaxID=1233460 RepID=A0A433WMN4_9BACT|nr:phage tail protein [Chitinophaga solisilvae]NSL86350.1 phage tail protein [Chitinophaga solisilvae]
MANYPMPKFHFSVEWGPGTKIGFTEITGLTMESDVIEYREGSSPEFHKVKMPGLQKLSNITLKRGTFQGDIGFHEWMETISMNTVSRRDVTIKLLNENHEPVITWQVLNAWPVKVQSSDLKADGNEVAIETMEIAHEGIKVSKQ